MGRDVNVLENEHALLLVGLLGARRSEAVSIMAHHAESERSPRSSLLIATLVGR